MKLSFLLLLTFSIPMLIMPINLYSQENKRKDLFALTIKVTDKKTNESLPGVVCVVKNLGLHGVTNAEGVATISRMPEGVANLEITYLGYEPWRSEIKIGKNITLDVKLVETNLSLNEVTVTATRSTNSLSNSSVIGRQAIDHLQASTLADLFELIPGNKIQGKVDKTQGENLTLRTLNGDDANNSFGTAIIVDGMAMSNNANPSDKLAKTLTAGSGIDTRQISTDDIESVEIITGVPSAEYGDLTSGAVIIKTKYGVTPLNARLKINPSAYNASVSKGFRAKGTGVVNTSFDYMKAYDDPRQKNTSLDRYTASAAYTKTFLNDLWYTTTKVSYNGIIDWQGKDPDQIDDGTFKKTSRNMIRVTHNGKFSFNKLFSRTMSYSIGYSYASNKTKDTKIVGVSGGKPIINTSTPGYHEVIYLTKDYMATGYNESKPKSFMTKLSNTFHINFSDKVQQRFNIGAEYNYEANNGKGYYDEDPSRPYKPYEDGRPRPFYDIPAINTLSAYMEDNFVFKIDRRREINIQAGVRYMNSQPGKGEQTQSLSPRINVKADIVKQLSVRAAYGLNSKSPGMNYLYPDKKYNDRVAAQYLPAGAPEEWIYYIHTNVYDVQRSKVKNITNQRFELGFDLKLPHGRNLNVVAYHDKMNNGYSPISDYHTYEANYYNVGHGIIPVPGSKPIIDWNNPIRTDIVWVSKGLVGNYAVAVNKGIEFNMNLGHFRSINTSFNISGAYRETQSWTRGTKVSSPTPVVAPDINAVPFKLIYPSIGDKTVSRNFTSTISAICNIPQLRMVATLTYQNSIYSYSWSQRDHILPTAWLDNDLSTHPITPEMLADPTCMIKGALLQNILPKPPNHDKAIINPPVGRINARLSMDVTKNLGVSFYSNNLFFYQPWQTNNLTDTPIKKNTGTFAFGVEAVIKL